MISKRFLAKDALTFKKCTELILATKNANNAKHFQIGSP